MMANNEEKECIENLLLVPCLITVEAHEIFVGINAHKILSIVECTHLSSLPSSHFPFIGIHDNHQEAVPVMDLVSVFKHHAKNLIHELSETSLDEAIAPIPHIQAPHDKIVICHLCNMTVGILVQSTYRIEDIKSDQVIPIPKVFENHPNCMFNGLYHYRGNFLYLLDLEGILDRLGLVQTVAMDTKQLPINTNQFAGKTVLIAEDSKVFRHQMTEFLLKNGFKCVVAKDGQEGLEKFLESPQSVDVIISDIEMPRMNGIEMVRRIQEITSNIPVLFNSSISNPALITEIENRHGCFLVKFKPDEILTTLAKLMS